MPLSLLIAVAGDYTIKDDGIPGNNRSVLLNEGTGAVIPFDHPADTLTITAGVPGVNIKLNFLDSLGSADLVIGSLTDAAVCPSAIIVQKVSTTGDVTLVATGSITEGTADAATDIEAGTLILSAGTGVGTAGNAIETQTSVMEAETGSGGINISNVGGLTIGGLSGDVSGLFASSGHVKLTNLGNIVIADTTGFSSLNAAGGDVRLTANGSEADITSSVNRDAISATGNIVLVAGRDVLFGVAGADYDNDVRAGDKITVQAGRDFVMDGFSDMASDDMGLATGGGVSITAGRQIGVLDLHGVDASVSVTSNTSTGNVVFKTGPGGSVVLTANSSAAVKAAPTGAVVINSDVITIEADSGITAGTVTLRPVSEGRDIRLGDGSDGPTAMGLSDAELDRVFATQLNIGSVLAGQILVVGDITPANAPNVSLFGSGDVMLGASIGVTTSLTVFAGDNLYQLGGTTVTAPSFQAIVDWQQADGGEGGTDVLLGSFVGAVRIDGSVDADALTGTAGAETLGGQGGADMLSGGDGNDTLEGGDGDDRLTGGIGADSLDGGTGTDWAQYDDAAGGLVADLQSPGTNTDIAAGDTYVSIENLLGSAFNDTLRGDAGANTLSGADGDDNLSGRAGNDTLDGGIGDDVLTGGVGADALQGGAGTDRAHYGDATVGVVADLQSPGVNTDIAAGDTYSSVENLFGSAFGDTLRGDTGGNTLWGANGDDLLQGRAGNDTLNGGQGNDTLSGGTGADELSGSIGTDSFQFDAPLNAMTNVDVITDFSVVNDTIRLDDAIFTVLPVGVLAAAAFTIGAAAADASDRIIYNSGTGALLYDPDGTGAAAAVQFAVIGTGLALTNADFVVF